MKKVFFILSVALFFSCNKGDISMLPNELAGTWEFEKFAGYPASYSFPPGNGKIIVLGKDKTFERRRHDTVVFKGNYTLQQKNDCGHQSYIAFSTNELISSESNIQLQDGKLTLSTPACYADGGTAFYIRK